jgi:hypothetical protein
VVETIDVLKILQAGGSGVLVLIGFFLWKLSKQMSDLKVSIDTLVDTLIRFVPGIKDPK